MLILLLAVSACCPPLKTDYSSPEATLLTWQAHLCHDDPDGEYRCLSDRFKQRTGNWQTYFAAREALLESEPLLATLLARADLEGRIVLRELSDDGRSARLDLDVGDDETSIAFLLETIIRLESADSPPIVGRTDRSVAELLRDRSGRRWIELTQANLLFTPEQLEAVVAVHLEQRWVIDDIEGLLPTGAPTAGSVTP